MVNITIDGKKMEVEKGTKILDAARQAHIKIPTLCYLKGINEIGACRACVVEIEGIERLVASCNNVVEEGMVIHTNSPKVRSARRANVRLIMSQHDSNCPACVRNGNCNLQSLASDLDIIRNPYKKKLFHSHHVRDLPLFRNYEKCIKCMRCIQICDKVQNLHIWDLSNTGSRTTVDVSGNRYLEESDCALCGQCITHCPVGALRERDDTEKILDALADPEKITVVQIAPSVRTAWGESFHLDREFATVNRLVAALRKMGFDYIFDTNFSADLTITEEANEFLDRYTNKRGNFPMFTSCCPAWIRFLKSQYPDMVDQLSTAKSPQQMFGAIAKSYYAELLNVSPDKICSISIMPCLAKKKECELPTMNDAGAGQDVDVVLTTREVDRLIRSDMIDVASLEEEEFDTPLGIGSGAGAIFGATGGVMEAALRTAYNSVTGENPDPDAFKDVRGLDGWKEATFQMPGVKLKVAVASGLGNARHLIEAIRRGEVKYDFVEIMACPGGCVGGGGQPIHDGQELAGIRGGVLYGLDAHSDLRFSHDNPSIIECYSSYLGRPLSEKAHHLLHTNHHGWKMPSEDSALNHKI